MSINFSDLQVILQRSQEIERLHQIQQHQSRVQQQQFAKKLDEQVKDKQERVQKEESAEQVRLDSHGRGNLKDGKRRNSADRNNGSNDEEPKADSGHIIDYTA